MWSRLDGCIGRLQPVLRAGKEGCVERRLQLVDVTTTLVPSCNRRSLSAPLARATIGPGDLGLCLAAVPIFCDREFSRKLSVSYGQPSQMVSSPMCQALTKELRQGRLPLTFPQREQKFHATRNEQIRKPMRDGPCRHDVQHGFPVL